MNLEIFRDKLKDLECNTDTDSFNSRCNKFQSVRPYKYCPFLKVLCLKIVREFLSRPSRALVSGHSTARISRHLGLVSCTTRNRPSRTI